MFGFVIERRAAALTLSCERGLPGGRSLLFVGPVVGRGRVELPAVSIPLGDLLAALELFVVVVGDAERLADVIHAILIRRRVVSARGFVTDCVGVVPLRVNVTRGQGGTGLGVLA